MMFPGDFRPGFVCNGNDLNGNPCPLRELPPEMLEMLSRPETIPVFAANGQRLRFPQPPDMHDMQPGGVMLLVPMRGPPPPGFARPMSPNHLDFVPPNPLDYVPPELIEQELLDEFGSESADSDFEDVDEVDNPDSVTFATCSARFNGIGDIKQFLDAVLEFKNSNDMSDDVALETFPLLFRGLVNDWWAEKRKYITDWGCAIKMFRNSYRLFPLQPRIFRRFFCLPQTTESTAEFIRRARGVFSTLPLPSFTEESQLDLAYSLLHNRIKEYVSRDDFDSFTGLLERAQQVEAVIAAANPQGPAPSNEPVEPDAPEHRPPSPPLVNSSDRGEASADPCKHCVTYGDILINMCQKLDKGEKTDEELKTLEKINKMDKEELNKMICFRCRSPSIVGLKCQKSGPENLSNSCPMISVRIHGRQFNVLVDTGSTHSIASDELVEHLVANGEELALKVLVMPPPAGGKPMQEVVRAATVDVWVGDVTVPAVFIVYPHTFGPMPKNVFGMDFVKDAGLVLDFRGAGTWTVRGTAEEQPALYGRYYRREPF